MLRAIIYIIIGSMPIIAFGVVIALVIDIFNRNTNRHSAANTITRDLHYYNTDYYKQTQQPYNETMSDKGKAGEYLIFEQLNRLAGHKQFIFNAYLPTDAGTTEIDIIMIHPTGLYVIESKNLCGLIKGNSKDIKWTQCLKGKRYKFYNPIRQNDRHISELKKHLPVLNDEAYKSIIAFNPAADINEITNDSNAIITKRHKILATIEMIAGREPQRFKDEHINKIQDILLKFTYTTKEERTRHIETIKQIGR